jgi:hypothetical protein
MEKRSLRQGAVDQFGKAGYLSGGVSGMNDAFLGGTGNHGFRLIQVLADVFRGKFQGRLPNGLDGVFNLGLGRTVSEFSVFILFGTFDFGFVVCQRWYSFPDGFYSDNGLPTADNFLGPHMIKR